MAVNTSPRWTSICWSIRNRYCRQLRVTDAKGRKTELSRARGRPGPLTEPLTCGDDDAALVGGHVWGWHVLLLHVAAVVHPDGVRAAHHLPTFGHAALIRGVPGGEEDTAFHYCGPPEPASLPFHGAQRGWARWRGRNGLEEETEKTNAVICDALNDRASSRFTY